MFTNGEKYSKRENFDDKNVSKVRRQTFEMRRVWQRQETSCDVEQKDKQTEGEGDVTKGDQRAEWLLAF